MQTSYVGAESKKVFLWYWINPITSIRKSSTPTSLLDRLPTTNRLLWDGRMTHGCTQKRNRFTVLVLVFIIPLAEGVNNESSVSEHSCIGFKLICAPANFPTVTRFRRDSIDSLFNECDSEEFFLHLEACRLRKAFPYRPWEGLILAQSNGRTGHYKFIAGSTLFSALVLHHRERRCR